MIHRSFSLTNAAFGFSLKRVLLHFEVLDALRDTFVSSLTCDDDITQYGILCK